MILETGDYFAVTRGIAYSMDSIFGSWLGNTAVNIKHGQRYDRSYDGNIYFAEEVCGPMVAAKCIGSTNPINKDAVGKVISLNTSEVEIYTLTKRFVETVLGSKSAIGNEAKSD